MANIDIEAPGADEAALSGALRSLVSDDLEAITFTAQAYTTVLGDLSKIKAGTTGETDATVTLLAAASAGEGAVQQILKADSAVGRQIIVAAGVALDVQCLQGDLSAFRVIGGAWVPIKVCAGLVGRGGPLPNTANASENVVATIAIPAGLMGLYSALHIIASFSCTNDANVKTYRARMGGIGGTAIASMTLTSTAGGRHQGIFANQGSLSLQHTVLSGSGIGTSSTGPGAPTVDMSAARDLVLTIQDAASTVNTNLRRYEVHLVR